MVSPNVRLANALGALSDLQSEDRHVFRSSEFSREHRERLVRNGYLRPVIKGWLMRSRPDALAHDATPWQAAVWEFCVRYCERRFMDRWHLSAELSLRLQAEDSSVPSQIMVFARQGGNNCLRLPFNTSLFDLRSPEMPAAADVRAWNGLRVHTVEAALLRVPAAFFRDCPVEARTALAGVRQIGGVAQRLLAGSHSTVAGRLAGAFRHIGRPDFAEEIARAMRNTGHDSFREVDPFVATGPQGEAGVAPRARRPNPPIAHRLRALWAAAREPVLSALPDAPGLPSGTAARRRYLDAVSAAYLEDAYHSLSMEGYRVTPDLIECVRSGDWDPEGDAADRRQRDALAARGYWQAFQAVRMTVEEILRGANPGALFRDVHGRWHFDLFQPFSAAGLYDPSALAGYRNRAVFLRGSRHVPPRAELLPDCMETLFDLLEQEREPTVRAVLGHWLLGYIHPHPDGNGRIARFLMNAMLASGGHPWVTIRVEDRKTYMAALEAASGGQDVGPFAEFVAQHLRPKAPAPRRRTPSDASPSPQPTGTPAAAGASSGHNAGGTATHPKPAS